MTEYINNLRITTLIENTSAHGGILGEFALSMLIETDEISLLFDCGRGFSTIYNAVALGCDLSGIDKIILSHGHNDHTGGLYPLFQLLEKETQIIAHPDIWKEKYYQPPDKPCEYAGIPYKREALESLGARFTLTNQPTNISDNIMTTGEIPMNTEFENVHDHLFVKEGDHWAPDNVPDDQALTIKTARGLVILSGCAHRGIINTVQHAKNITGLEKVYLILGGLHLFDRPMHRIKKTINTLKKLNIKKIGVSHCTGMEATIEIAKAFGNKFFLNNAGTVTQII
jgi:7,8-dihydropterin-6-yl-methyl-4-(beta-D-ribofuranosyl)aminobenzene 5'-phosphate synthase